QRTQPMAMRQQIDKRDAPEQSIRQGKRGALVQLSPASLHDAAEMDATRAHAFAIATHQALLEVCAVVRVRLDASFVQRLDEMDATTRRFSLVSGQQIGWAVLQAQPAVHALRQVCGRGLGAQTHMPSGTSPGMPARRPSMWVAAGVGSILVGLKLPEGSIARRT